MALCATRQCRSTLCAFFVGVAFAGAVCATPPAGPDGAATCHRHPAAQAWRLEEDESSLLHVSASLRRGGAKPGAAAASPPSSLDEGTGAGTRTLAAQALPARALPTQAVSAQALPAQALPALGADRLRKEAAALVPKPAGSLDSHLELPAVGPGRLLLALSNLTVAAPPASKPGARRGASLLEVQGRARDGASLREMVLSGVTVGEVVLSGGAAKMISIGLEIAFGVMLFVLLVVVYYNFVAGPELDAIHSPLIIPSKIGSPAKQTTTPRSQTTTPRLQRAQSTPLTQTTPRLPPLAKQETGTSCVGCYANAGKLQRAQTTPRTQTTPRHAESQQPDVAKTTSAPASVGAQRGAATPRGAGTPQSTAASPLSEAPQVAAGGSKADEQCKQVQCEAESGKCTSFTTKECRSPESHCATDPAEGMVVMKA